ncbi:MAG: hypothetical protein H7Y20_14715 [Bryobacteraceae bacterium]|nr:hypothetical protein [Bryobacteraceae bacterium]
MTQTASFAISQLATILRGDDGVNAAYAALVTDQSSTPPALAEILELYAPPDLTEKASSIRYPVIHIYCDRIVNSLKEKFRTFSGTADLNIDVRVSHDHLNELGSQLQFYLQGITDVLDRKRGHWADGMFYTGGYEILFSPVKRGGRNYLQSARVSLEVHINLD